ncbi:MAG: hypothetical protein FWF78_07830 [Defluviitaleaceae bacterium]|nr:hypothetical protein [Defluviitaleaceae bacterium]
MFNKFSSKRPNSKFINEFKKQHSKLIIPFGIFIGVTTVISLFVAIRPIVSDIFSSESYIETTPTTNTFAPDSEEIAIEDELFINTNFRTIPLPSTDINAIISANTSIKVERVELEGVRDGISQGIFNMHSTDSKNWVFNANFYETGIYFITITAFTYDGEVSSITMEINYPVDWLLNILN